MDINTLLSGSTLLNDLINSFTVIFFYFYDFPFPVLFQSLDPINGNEVFPRDASVLESGKNAFAEMVHNLLQPIRIIGTEHNAIKRSIR